MIDKLAGYKTYISIALAFAWVVLWLKVPSAKDAISLENFGIVLSGLLAMGGISIRMAQAQTHAAVTQRDQASDPSVKLPTSEGGAP